MATERQLPEVGEEIHLPGPSAQPLLVAIFTTIALLGLTSPWPVLVFGLVGLALTLAVWTRDAVLEYRALPDDHGHSEHYGREVPEDAEHGAH